MADADARPLPVHQITRWSGEMYMAIGRASASHLTPNHDRAVIALLLARLCVADWSAGVTIAPPSHPTRFGSINALARSLGRPFETVRRHVHALAAEGLAVIDARGVAIRTDGPTSKRVVAFYVAAHDLLLRLIEEYHALGVLPPPRPAPTRPLLPAILATALDINLLPFESWRDAMGDWTSMALWGAIAAANVRHITTDPVLSAHYAADYVPDARRVPVSLAVMCRTLGIPYATAWRHAAALEQRGMMRRTERGWIVEQAHYRLPAIAAGSAASIHYGLRRIGELVALGLDPADMARLYLNGRPEPVVLA